MIASLPMYAYPWTAAADAAFWSAIRDRLRARGIDAPETLIVPKGDLLDHWRDPGLVLSQTCGRPYKMHLHGEVTLVGTPDFGLEGCPPGYYRAVVIARASDDRTRLDDFAGSTFAVNGGGSQSGWAALAAEAPEVLAGPRLVTGGHRASAHAVRIGAADFAAIDAVSFRLLEAVGEAGGLRIFHATPPQPGLPYIARSGQDAAATFAAVAEAIAALPAGHRDRPGPRGLVAIPAEAYLALPDPRAEGPSDAP